MPLMQNVSMSVTNGQGETLFYEYIGRGTVELVSIIRGGYSGGGWLYPVQFEIDGNRTEVLGNETVENVIQGQAPLQMSGIQFSESFKIFLLPAYTGTATATVLIDTAV